MVHSFSSVTVAVTGLMVELWVFNPLSPSMFCLQKKCEATVEHRGLSGQCAASMIGRTVVLVTFKCLRCPITAVLL